jgi:multidrug efflux pump subunit AcrA (membrane-fusion protein)
MAGTHTDLQALSVRRTLGSSSTLRAPRRWVSRVLLPTFLLLGFAALAGWAGREYLLPASPVSVTPVIGKKDIVLATGAELFSATGWIEPRPTAIDVTALAEGVVEELLVLPGQTIAKNQIVARLIDKDARLALQAAEEDLAERRLRAESAEADIAEAQAQLRAADVVARSEEELFQNKAIGRARYEQAVAQQAVARAKLKQAEARAKEHVARVRQGEVAVSAAHLKLERMTVRSPAAGVVMQLNTVPGRMVGVRSLGANQLDALVTLYDPGSLQVRVEVPIDRFHLVRPGQQASVEVDVIPGERLLGTVLYDTHETDINRNTVRVKVGLVRQLAGTFAWPWPLPAHEQLAAAATLHCCELAVAELNGPLKKLRPGMIAKVRIISPPTATAQQGGEVLRLMIPQGLVVKEGDKHLVWIANQEAKTAVLTPVVLGRGRQGELIEIVSGLQPSDKLITSGREQLKPGERIRIVREE